jgi:hypothetical protein
VKDFIFAFLYVLACCIVYRPANVTSQNTATVNQSEGDGGTRRETSEAGATNADNDDNWDKVKQKLKQKLRDITEETVTSVAAVITVPNVKKAACFTAVFIAACVTGILHSVRYIGDYSLKFMREMSVFIQVSTPVFLAVIEFFAKCVGGFYLLIAMLWRGSNVQPPRTVWQPNRKALPMPPNMDNRRMR